ncbi:MAG TPA: branched-chain amino acid ABC transporter substrate-binding protein [Mycobacteriales bacterium]|nr:branched-chain amino acid ABC transporter substrate-binding protein [Mycobacteriales bacterium]
MIKHGARAFGAVVAAGAVVLAAAACGSGKSGGDGVQIAFMGALTGPNAQLGINIYDGAKLAIDQHNAKKGVTKVTLKKYDTQGDPTQASQQARKVISDKNVAVIGPAFSGESKTADPVLESGKMPNISPSATAVSLAQNGWKYWHRALANDDVQGPGDADYLANQVKAKSVAVIDDQSEYGLGLGDAVRKQLKTDGVTVNPSDKIDPNGSDYSTTVNKITAAKPDAVFFAGYYSAAAKLVKQLRDGGFTGTFMSGDGSQDQKLGDQGGQAAEGAIVSCTCSLAVGSSDPAAQKFEKDYTAKWKTGPSTYSSEGFDSTNIVLKAIDSGKKDTEAINDFLKTVDYKGVSKEIKFNDKGELSAPLLFISQFQNGKLTYLGDIKTAKAKLTQS